MKIVFAPSFFSLFFLETSCSDGFCGFCARHRGTYGDLGSIIYTNTVIVTKKMALFGLSGRKKPRGKKRTHHFPALGRVMSGYRRMMRQDPQVHCINPARSDWLRGNTGMLRRVTSSDQQPIYPSRRLTTRRRYEESADLEKHSGKRLRTGRTVKSRQSAAHHEGDRSHPGRPMWQPDRGEGRTSFLFNSRK